MIGQKVIKTNEIFDEECKQEILMKKITRESGCQSCPNCGSKEVVNKISFDEKLGAIGYTYQIACKDCKKSYELTGIIPYNEMIEISLSSSSTGEYSYRLLVIALSKARIQIENSLHGMEKIPVITNKTIN